MFDFLNQSLVLFGNAKNFTTTPLELIAVALTIISVWGATQLKVGLQYAVGILATATFFFVFKNAGLVSSAALQVYFTVIQLYGWWYWLYGVKAPAPGTVRRGSALDRRTAPPIGNWRWGTVAIFALAATAVSLLIGAVVNSMFDAKAVFWDSAILCASVLAQFLLDRKQIKTWVIWGIVNAISIYVYGFVAGLGVSGVLYAILLVNVFLGYATWFKRLTGKNWFNVVLEDAVGTSGGLRIRKAPNVVKGDNNTIIEGPGGDISGNTISGSGNTFYAGDEPLKGPYTKPLEK